MPTKLEIDIPDECVKILKSEGIDNCSEWIREFITRQLLDVKRTLREGVHTKLMWNRELHAATVDHVGSDDIAAFVRDCVYANLREYDVMPPPQWKTVRRRSSTRNALRGSGPDLDYRGKDVLHAVKMPRDWLDVIKREKCHMVSTYVMACVQNFLQRENDEIYPAKNTMRPFLDQLPEKEVAEDKAIANHQMGLEG